MPTLDVSDVLDDPDFQDVFDLITTTYTVNPANGRTVETPVTIPNVVGVVQMDKGRNRDLMAEGTGVAASIEVHTRTRINGGVPGQIADQIIWDGKTHIVTHVDNYSRYGGGYICAYADLLALGGEGNGQ